MFVDAFVQYMVALQPDYFDFDSICNRPQWVFSAFQFTRKRDSQASGYSGEAEAQIKPKCTCGSATSV
jgi:hypothetical protein